MIKKLSIIFLLVCAASFAFVSCAKDNGVQSSDAGGDVIKLTTSIGAPLTKGTSLNQQGTQIAANEKVGVFIADASTTDVFIKNKSFTADGAGYLNGDAMYWGSHSSIKVFAYHPYNSDWTEKMTENNPFSVATDQSSDANYYASDLLFATGTATRTKATAATGDVNLVFSHKLTKIGITITKGTGMTDAELSGATINIVNVKTATTFNPSDGSTGAATGDATTVKASVTTSAALTGAAIIVPQTLAPSHFVEVVIGSAKYYFTLPDAKTFEQGKYYTYTLRINKGSLDMVLVASDIVVWDNVNVTVSKISDEIFYDANVGTATAPATALGSVASASATTNNGLTYLISTAEELKWVMQNPTAVNSYKLVKDVRFIGQNVWTPIGSESAKFKGNFDGGNHTISDLYLNLDISYVGFFGCVDGSEIENIFFSNINLYCQAFTGGLVGNAANSKIINVGVGDGSYVKSRNDAGGIAGTLYKTVVKGCSNMAEVSGNQALGGIAVSLNSSTVEFCCNYGIIISVQGMSGGIACKSTDNSVIEGCWNEGTVTVTGESTDGVAGIVFDNTNKSVVNTCYNVGKLSGHTLVSGIVSENYSGSGVFACYNAGEITCDASKQYCGGIVGRCEAASSTAVFGCLFVQTSSSAPANGIGYGTDDTNNVQFAPVTVAEINSYDLSKSKGYMYMNNLSYKWYDFTAMTSWNGLQNCYYEFIRGEQLPQIKNGTWDVY
jgi:hypothetical protein